MKKRNLEIDTLRGFACILLVSFHTVGVDANSGLKLDDGIYRDISDILSYIRMPIFTFLSGIVYANRPINGDTRLFIKGKFRRLIIPMLVVGTLFAILQSMVPSANSSINNWFLIHIEPVAHFWFIESLFLIFLILVPLEFFNLFKTQNRWLMVFIVSSILYMLDININYFSISGAIYLFPFFLLGMALKRYSIMEKLSVTVGLLMLTTVLILLIIISLGFLNVDPKGTLLSIMIGGMACFGLLSLRIKSKALAKIGTYSYSIYIYHVFFTAGTKVFINTTDSYSINLIFCLSLLAGIVGPIVTEHIFNKTNFTRITMLGKSKLKLQFS